MHLAAKESHRISPLGIAHMHCYAAWRIQDKGYSYNNSLSNNMYSPFTDITSDPIRYSQSWEPKVLAYRKALDDATVKSYFAPESLSSGLNAIDVPDKVLADKDVEITSMSASALCDKMARGELTAEDTFNAFARRATIAHQLCNCAMEFFIEEGLERARYLDKYFAETGKTVGPLHGLPVSLKEHYGYKDRVVHAGYVSRLDFVSKEHAVVTQNLFDSGAVFYVRTTEPQSLMHLDSFNNITGWACNPNNSSLSPGGSSSGEGIIVSMSGSPMGVGSDIGGSIRGPAAFCGCWGLRPTQKRISMKGAYGPGTGCQESVMCVIGPLARFPEDLSLFMKSVISQEPWKKDAELVPLPWREVSMPNPKEVTIAIEFDDGIVHPHPPITRGLHHVASKLKEAGCRVIEWKPHRVEEAIMTVNQMYTADGNAAQLEALAESGEPLAELTKWCLGMGNGTRGVSVSQNQLLNAARNSMRGEYQKIMEQEKIDFILTPTYNGVAPKLGTVKYWGYTALFNLLDLPNIVFPTGLAVDETLDLKDGSYQPRSEIEEYEWGLYTGPQDFKDAPICLQLTGRRYFDEEVVKAGELLREIL